MTQRPKAVLPGGENSRPPPYRLSALLRGHTNDVRAVAATSCTASPRLLSASRDGTARAWVRAADGKFAEGGWMEERVWRDGHEGYINAVAFVPPRRGDEDEHGFLATAGADSLIQLYSLSPTSPPTHVHTLLGHAGNVCALHCAKDGQRMVSASWDCTVRVWDWRDGPESEGGAGEWSCERVLVDHEAAVWDVLLLEHEKDSVLTGSADSRIRMFEGSDVRYVFKGHEGPVRALAKLLPDDPGSTLFASASNDSTIRVWNYQSGDALTVLGSHNSFIYSLATIPSTAGGGLASSGEDGIIAIWNEEDGEKDQEVPVPALSVWSIATLPNGDLACGCSDDMIWVFTRDPQRAADEATQADYDARMAELRAKKTPQKPQPVVHELAALDKSGDDGEVKLVRRGDTTVAYQFRGGLWEELGEVVESSEAPSDSAAPVRARDKMEYNGQEYDFVFAIDVKDDEPPLQLPFNLEDDPHAVATAFVAEHELPDSYLEQIVDFIRASTA